MRNEWTVRRLRAICRRRPSRRRRTSQDRSRVCACCNCGRSPGTGCWSLSRRGHQGTAGPVPDFFQGRRQDLLHAQIQRMARTGLLMSGRGAGRPRHPGRLGIKGQVFCTRSTRRTLKGPDPGSPGKPRQPQVPRRRQCQGRCCSLGRGPRGRTAHRHWRVFDEKENRWASRRDSLADASRIAAFAVRMAASESFTDVRVMAGVSCVATGSGYRRADTTSRPRRSTHSPRNEISTVTDGLNDLRSPLPTPARRPRDKADQDLFRPGTAVRDLPGTPLERLVFFRQDVSDGQELAGFGDLSDPRQVAFATGAAGETQVEQFAVRSRGGRYGRFRRRRLLGRCQRGRPPAPRPRGGPDDPEGDHKTKDHGGNGAQIHATRIERFASIRFKQRMLRSVS